MICLLKVNFFPFNFLWGRGFVKGNEGLSERGMVGGGERKKGKLQRGKTKSLPEKHKFQRELHILFD